MVLRNVRSWPVPGCKLLPFMVRSHNPFYRLSLLIVWKQLVSSKRVWHTGSTLLFGCHGQWSLRWLARCCYRQNGWCRRKTWLGLDLVRALAIMSLYIYWTSASILEGLATVVAGIASFWIIQDFPDTAKFLTTAERTVVVRRLQGDDQFSAAGEKLKMKYIYQSLLDWKTWIGSEFLPNLVVELRKSDRYGIVMVYCGCDMPLYAFSLFLPSIISQVSFSAVNPNSRVWYFCNSLVCLNARPQSNRCINCGGRIQGNTSKPANRASLCIRLYYYMSSWILCR